MCEFLMTNAKLVKFNGSWVLPNYPQKMRVCVCLLYPDSAPTDWILRLRHWHCPCAISPLHDKDTYDEDKMTILYKVDDLGNVILNADGEPEPMKDENGKIMMKVWHKFGDVKKPHYHVMIAYGNSTTPQTFMKIINDIGGVIPPWDHMEVISVMSMYRYFSHLDDPDKYQYDPSDTVLLGGFDPVNYQTYKDKNEPFKDVLKLIEEHPKELTSYSNLANYLNGKDDRLFYFVMNHTVALNGLFAKKK